MRKKVRKKAYFKEIVKDESEFCDREQSPSSFSDSESEETRSGSTKKESEGELLAIEKLKKLSPCSNPQKYSQGKGPLRSSTTSFFKSNSIVNKNSPSY
jgi:hypothetical protein